MMISPAFSQSGVNQCIKTVQSTDVYKYSLDWKCLLEHNYVLISDTVIILLCAVTLIILLETFFSMFTHQKLRKYTDFVILGVLLIMTGVICIGEVFTYTQAVNPFCEFSKDETGIMPKYDFSCMIKDSVDNINMFFYIMSIVSVSAYVVFLYSFYKKKNTNISNFCMMISTGSLYVMTAMIILLKSGLI